MSSLDPNDDGAAGGSEPAVPAVPRIARRRRSFVQRHPYLIVSLAVVAILAGLGIGLHVANFYATSSSQGGSLIQHERDQQTRARAKPVACQPLGDSVSGPQALVEAHGIGLTAPVEGGVSDAVLNVAVGHVPGSSWPNQPGTTLLAAHDVSYFSGIDQLQTGQTITFSTPCDTYVYRVTGHQIVAAGSPLYTSPAQSLLVLETCYPLNALFITSQRYLVTADLVKVLVESHSLPTALPQPTAPSVPAPAPLAAQGLTLDDNEVQLGVLNLAGSPASSWTQGPEPMADEAAALADYFAGLRSAEQNQPQWWSQLAPDVGFSAAQPLVGTGTDYLGSLTPTLAVQGSVLTGATIDVSVAAGGSDYALHVVETVVGNTLEITQWELHPSG